MLSISFNKFFIFCYFSKNIYVHFQFFWHVWLIIYWMCIMIDISVAFAKWTFFGEENFNERILFDRKNWKLRRKKKKNLLQNLLFRLLLLLYVIDCCVVILVFCTNTEYDMLACSPYCVNSEQLSTRFLIWFLFFFKFCLKFIFFCENLFIFEILKFLFTFVL